MKESFSDTELTQLSEFVESQMGLHFPKERWQDLARAITTSAHELGFKTKRDGIQGLIGSPLSKRQIEILASHLTVGETYFFREKKAFEVLEEHMLPLLARARQNTDRRLRIWSAGCCTGEEAYSIAISISRVIPDWKNWNITILATDINQRFLKKAQEGAYSEWSFRDVHPGIKTTYFSSTTDGRFHIHPSLKSMVQFSYLNLAEDAYPSLLTNTNGMDVVFCRNVLMYFTQQRMKTVINNLHRSLIDGGWLIVSPTEASHVQFSQFKAIDVPGTIIYQKTADAAGKVELPAPFVQVDTEIASDQDFYAAAFKEEQKAENSADGGSEPTVREYIRKAGEGRGEKDNFEIVYDLYKRGLYAEAASHIERVLGNGKEDPNLMALLARVLANQGKLPAAETWAQKANVIDKTNPAHRYLLATILQEQRKFDQAMVSLKQALYLDQKFVLGHFTLGTIARTTGKSDEAARYFANVLSLLHEYRDDEILPESEGITAGRLTEIIKSTMNGQQFDGRKKAIR